MSFLRSRGRRTFTPFIAVPGEKEREVFQFYALVHCILYLMECYQCRSCNIVEYKAQQTKLRRLQPRKATVDCGCPRPTGRGTGRDISDTRTLESLFCLHSLLSVCPQSKGNLYEVLSPRNECAYSQSAATEGRITLRKGSRLRGRRHQT